MITDGDRNPEPDRAWDREFEGEEHQIPQTPSINPDIDNKDLGGELIKLLFSEEDSVWCWTCVASPCICLLKKLEDRISEIKEYEKFSKVTNIQTKKVIVRKEKEEEKEAEKSSSQASSSISPPENLEEEAATQDQGSPGHGLDPVGKVQEVLDGEVPPKIKNSDPNEVSQEPSRSGNPQQRWDQKQEEIKIKKNHLVAMLGEGLKKVEENKQLIKVKEVLEVLDKENPPNKMHDLDKLRQEPSSIATPELGEDQKQEEIKTKTDPLLLLLREGARKLKQVEKKKQDGKHKPLKKSKQLGKVEEVLEVLDRENPPIKNHDLDKLCQEPSSIATPELGEDQRQEEIKIKKDPLLLLLREGERKQKQVEKQKQEEKQKRTPGRKKKEQESGTTVKMQTLLENWRKQPPDSRTTIKEKLKVKLTDHNNVVVRKQETEVEAEVEVKKTVEVEVTKPRDKPEKSQVMKPSEKSQIRRSVSSIKTMFSQATKQTSYEEWKNSRAEKRKRPDCLEQEQQDCEEDEQEEQVVNSKRRKGLVVVSQNGLTCTNLTNSNLTLKTCSTIRGVGEENEQVELQAGGEQVLGSEINSHPTNIEKQREISRKYLSEKKGYAAAAGNTDSGGKLYRLAGGRAPQNFSNIDH